MGKWQPATITPPNPGVYEIRIHAGDGDYLQAGYRMWTGEQWRSRNGALPTIFGSGDDLTQHEWRDIGADNKEQ